MELHSAFRCPGFTETLAALGVLLNSHVLGHDVDGNHGKQLLVDLVRAPFAGGRSAGSLYFRPLRPRSVAAMATTWLHWIHCLGRQRWRVVICGTPWRSSSARATQGQSAPRSGPPGIARGALVCSPTIST